MFGLPMGKHRVKHGAEDDDTDNDADPQTHVVNLLNALAHFGNAGPHVHICGKHKLGDTPKNRDHQAVLQPAGESLHACRRTLREGIRNDSPYLFL